MFTNNNASQTLFRFTANRNAELANPKNKEKRFIFRKDTQKGVFDAKLNSSTTLQKLCENPSALPLTVETEQSLKTKDPVFYDLAVWIARNKSSATKAEFDAKIKEYKDYLTVNKKVMLSIDVSIWDNLVYQVTTQKDFYAKETLMQYLHLGHILTVYTNSDEEIYNDVIKAKVVLPKEFFKTDNRAATGTGTTGTSKVVYNEANMKFAEAKINIQANKNLASAIDSMEKSYRKLYQQAYKEALSNYEKEAAPIRKEHQNLLAEQEYQRQLFIDSGDKEQLSRLSYIPAPKLPEFTFEFQPEIEERGLQSQLTTDQQNTLNRVLQSTSSSLENISTFAELNQLINQDNQALQQIVLDNTVLNQQVSSNVGGVVVPVSNSANANGWIPYSVKTYNRNNTDWFIMLTIDNYAHNIVSGSYKVTINGVDTSSTTVFQAVNGVNFLFYNGITIPASQTARINGFILSGEVVLEDGKTYLLNVTLVRDDSDVNTVLKQGAFKGSAAFTLKDTGGTSGGTGTGTGSGTTSNPSTGAFIPSGFGMKNIGITDYKKVEQSTYCYMEGDVAHIENIMAREYKERATRRLKRNESQTTKSSESEKEKLTDTTSTERHEMQSEISKILQESKDFAAQAGFSASWGMGDNKYGLNIGANYATHNSKEESNRQALTEAKDITARALDRIVTKVKEERIDKIIEEYEENNKHGFDNTKGSSHVVGVYRWVDKVVKNQIYNYGKRMMFEFMVPEPAKLHNLGMKISNNAENQLIKPVDPRESNVQKIETFSSLEDETKLKYWISKYNVEIDEFPVENKSIGWQYGFSDEVDGSMSNNKDVALDIPEGYYTRSWNFGQTGSQYTGSKWGISVGNDIHVGGAYYQTYPNQRPLNKFVEKLPISVYFDRYWAGTVAIEVQLSILPEYKKSWLQKTFNKIIEAYEAELSKYEAALAEARALGVQIKGSNPGFYRKIENTILRRNCISYMLEQNPNADLTFGKKRYYTNDGGAEETFLNTDIKVDGKLDQYAAFVKFMEQAFEWEIMSYNFYPYYWGERKSWADLYQFDDNDPIFRAFMQSGMARVIVTVRPGFEEAVRHFFATGQIWNGGEVPVIDDPLFLSIVDEMRSPKATKEGEPWREKIPTSLTILQADSIGLKVEKALPCNCEPGVKFDDNLGEMCGSNFELNNNQLGQSSDKWMQFSLTHLDNNKYFKTIGGFDEAGLFPRQYECMGHSIVIDRDAKWLSTDPLTKMYQALADEISQIEGVEAYPTEDEGITFKLLASKITNFTFTKPGGEDEFDHIKFSINLDESYVKFTSPMYGSSSSDKILDKDGYVIPKDEYMNKVSLSRFLI